MLKNIKIDGSIKKVVRLFRRCFKKAFEAVHDHKFYGWINDSFREKARAFLLSYNLSAIDEAFYDEHEGEFIFFLYHKFGSSRYRTQRSRKGRSYENLAIFKTLFKIPT